MEILRNEVVISSIAGAVLSNVTMANNFKLLIACSGDSSSPRLVMDWSALLVSEEYCVSVLVNAESGCDCVAISVCSSNV